MTKRRRHAPPSEGLAMVIQDKAKSFLRWKDRESDSKPTPERLRKAQDGQTELRGGGDTGYRQASPVEHYNGHWSEDEQMAFAKFAFESGIVPQQRVTINYDATGGGNSHNRMGGIGNQTARMMEIFERHQWVRRQLLLQSAYVLDAMTGELRDEATGRQYTFEDVGGLVFPHLRDKATRKGIGVGRFIGACQELVQLYKEVAVIEAERKRRANGALTREQWQRLDG